MFKLPGQDWKQRMATCLLITALACMGILSPPNSASMVIVLVTLFMWTVNRKDESRNKNKGD